MMSWVAQTYLAGRVFETPGLDNQHQVRVPMALKMIHELFLVTHD